MTEKLAKRSTEADLSEKFDKWWKQTQSDEITPLNESFKEVAYAAWMAAMETARDEGGYF